MHHLTHRVLTDLHHRSIGRTAAEKWNRALHCDNRDIFSAEFTRTYLSAPFSGGSLFRRLEMYEKSKSVAEMPTRFVTSEGSKSFMFLMICRSENVFFAKLMK